MLYADRLRVWTERLAHHALQGGVWDKAYDYFRQAGTSAMAGSAHREAVTCLEQALAALQHLPEHRDTIEQAIDLRFSLRGVLLQLGEFERVRTYMHEAEALAQTLDDPHRFWRAQAHAECSTAVMLFRSLHMTLWLSQAENALAQVL